MSWKELGFEIEITGDGSPSLRLLESKDPLRDKGEAMHHSGGALSETELIYGTVIKECFARVEQPHFCVVGLGLGYIELLIAREALARGQSFLLTSYELRTELRDFFRAFICDEVLPPEIRETYQKVLSSLSLDEDHQKMKGQLKKALEKGLFKIQGGLNENNFPTTPVNCISYDAYSSKTDPELWDEDFLKKFLSTVSADLCWLSTYASRGSLKRALQAAGYEVETLMGFQGKRNSTKATFIRQVLR